jgi:uncharacterized damage-inducible protein DinB
MDFDLQRGREILERTPSAIIGLLRGLPPEWTHVNEGPRTWSAHQVVAHLINGERTDWIPRAKLVLSADPNATFVPFEREGFFEEALRLDLDDLLDQFAALRAGSLRALDGFRLTDRELAMTAMHPALGRVSLRQLLASWVVHDLGHIAQISRVMAKQYRDAVGPWTEYMSVLSK